MVVRRYVVKQMPEAVALMRRDLGRDAVILSTRNIFLKRWMGLWRMRRIEVLAAAGDDVSLPDSQQRPAQKSRSQPSAPVAARPTESVAATVQPLAPAVQPAQAIEPLAQSVRSATAVLAPPARPEGASDLRQSVQSELASIRKMLENAIVAPRGSSASVLQHMLSQGMDEGLALELLAEAHRPGSDVEAVVDEEHPLSVGQVLRARLLRRLSPTCEPEPIRSTSRLVAFVGPTGVGKTTTIAKLAAQQVLAGERRVGIITTDTFRIAAIDQLRTYANILQAPLETVYEPGDLTKALERLADCDLILMDTAGRNFSVDSYVDEVRAVLAHAQVDETYLVLAMTTKSTDLDQIARSFLRAPIDKFLLTKIDETLSYGSAVNLLLRHPKPLSYVTTGQNVPDDIEVASLQKLVNCAMGADDRA